MSNQNSTPPPPNVELEFQMQAMTKMIERMNFVMGNVCDRLEKVGKHGNVAGTCTQYVRKVGAEPKSNNSFSGVGEIISLSWFSKELKTTYRRTNWLRGVILILLIRKSIFVG
jgi:hypothetical protein